MRTDTRNGTGQDIRGGATTGRGRRTGRVLLAGAALAMTTMVGAAGPATSAECSGPLLFLRLCGAAPPPVAVLPPVTLPPVTLPPVTVPPVTVPPVLAPPPAPLSAPDAARRLLDLVNGERQKAGLGQLTSRDDITAIALAHSERMAQAGDIFHSDTFLGAAVKSLLNAGARGENVAYNGDIDSAHARLMASPGHRANILDRRFTAAGFGVVRHADGRYFITEDFIQAAGAPRPATPRPASPAASRSAAPPRAAVARPAPPKPVQPPSAAPAPVPAPVATPAPVVPVPVPAAAVLSAAADAPVPAAPLHGQRVSAATSPTTAAAVVLLALALSACWVVPRRLAD